ncbi:uncharacterized protein [Battus philenor]|uniref:uncharacterized protein n=1 Tax=Battus philenor TaxID=42288 RepID=UPI0035CE9375
MRARAATIAFALCFCISNALEPTHFFSTNHKISNLLTCSQSLGPSKCLTAFSSWRAQKAINLILNSQTTFDLNDDLEQFPWKRYANETEDQLYTNLCNGTERLLQFRQLDLNLNEDYTLRLGSKGNGNLNVDVIKNTGNTGRGYMKKWRKKFFNIIPLLLVPGLIMSAILPFVLPALKMMVIAVGMLNNMALSGAVFTLLRNNAFNEANQHRIIYVNEGYHNEKHYPLPNNLHHYSTSNEEVFGDPPQRNAENVFLSGNTEVNDVALHANLPWTQNDGITSHLIYADTKIRRNGESVENKTAY